MIISSQRPSVGRELVGIHTCTIHCRAVDDVSKYQLRQKSLNHNHHVRHYISPIVASYFCNFFAAINILT